MKWHLVNLSHEMNEDVVTAYSCEVCFKSFETSKFLKKHKANHNKYNEVRIASNWLTSFSCDFCEGSFSTADVLQNHLELHRTRNVEKQTSITIHQNEQTKLFPCSKCKSVKSSNKFLQRHMDCHTNCEKYKLKQFNKKMERWTKRWVDEGVAKEVEKNQPHPKKKVEQIKRLKCPCKNCLSTFPDSSKLAIHMQWKHPDIKPKLGPENTPTSVDISSITRDEMYFDQMNIIQKKVCSEVEQKPIKAFNDFKINDYKAILMTLQVHNLICDLCNEEFHSNNALKEHMDLHKYTKTTEIPYQGFGDHTRENIANSMTNKVEHFTCDLCCDIFDSINSFKEHTESHKYPEDTCIPHKAFEEHTMEENKATMGREQVDSCKGIQIEIDVPKIFEVKEKSSEGTKFKKENDVEYKSKGNSGELEPGEINRKRPKPNNINGKTKKKPSYSKSKKG